MAPASDEKDKRRRRSNTASVITLYEIASQPPIPVLVFRLIDGRVQIESLNGYPTNDWDCVLDPETDRFIEPAQGKAFMAALLKQDHWYQQLVEGEPPQRSPEA